MIKTITELTYEMRRVHTVDNLHRSVAWRGSTVLHRNNNGRFIRCTASAFTGSGRTKVRIINLNDDLKFIASIAISYDMRPMKYGVSSDRGLMPAGATLKHLAPLKKMGFGMTELGTLKPVRPSDLV